MELRSRVYLMTVKATDYLLCLGHVHYGIERHLLRKALAATCSKEIVKPRQTLWNDVLPWIHGRHDCPWIIMFTNAIEGEWQQQFRGEFHGRVASHQLEHDVHRHRVPLSCSVIPLDLHDLPLIGKILANEVHFLMGDAHEFSIRKSTVMKLMPDFPTRTLGRCQIVHDTHCNTIDGRRQRHAAIAAQPIGHVLQRLEYVVANLFRVIVCNKSSLTSIRHQERARIQRIITIQTTHVGAMNKV